MKWLICTPIVLLAALGCSDTPVAPEQDPDDILDAEFLTDIAGTTLRVSPGLILVPEPVELHASVAVSPHSMPLQEIPQELTISDLWVVSEGVFFHQENPDLIKSKHILTAKLTNVEISNLSGVEVTVAVRVTVPFGEAKIVRSLTVLFPEF